MAGLYFITGSYTEQDSPAKVAQGKGIALYKFDQQSGACELQSRLFLRNPSYPRYFKQTGKIYAPEELMDSDSPTLASIEWNGSDNLSVVETINIPGSYACHLDICNGYLVLSNYTSGDVTLIKLADKTVQVIKHDGNSVNAERQESPHPHMIHAASDNRFFVSDLGIDKIIMYEYGADGRWTSKSAIETPRGSGPRHMVFTNNENYLIVVGELVGNVLLYKQTGQTYTLVDEIKLMNGPASTAAIRLHPSGKYFYVSDRATNKVYLLSATADKIQILASFNCEGETPRDISIDPSRQWLLASNQDSNNISVFKIDAESGHLRYSHSVNEPTPVCVSWL